MKDFWKVKGVIIYSTGWLAAYGAIRGFKFYYYFFKVKKYLNYNLGLVRSFDHVVTDRLSHNCIMEATARSTSNVHFIEHLNNAKYRAKI